MTVAFHIRQGESRDAPAMAAAFHKLETYERYFQEQEGGRRTVLVAFLADIFVGYLTISWGPPAGPLPEAHIPEIQDFNVIAAYRRRGIGTALMDEAERRVAERSAVAGIGVGLYADYGPAQRMYVKRGYVPDGRGLLYDGRVVEPGTQVRVDDSLTLQLLKRLRE